MKLGAVILNLILNRPAEAGLGIFALAFPNQFLVGYPHESRRSAGRKKVDHHAVVGSRLSNNPIESDAAQKNAALLGATELLFRRSFSCDPTSDETGFRRSELESRDRSAYTVTTRVL